MMPAIRLSAIKEKKMRKVKLIVVLGVTLGLLTFGLNMPEIVHAESQTKCPVMGGKVDEKIFADYQGKRIYFCCTGCLEEFKKDPEKYLNKMKEEGMTPAKTH
jgi:YHS domain-containing protein